MSDQLWLAIIGGIVTIVTTVCTLIVTLRTRHDVQVVKHQTNSMQEVMQAQSRAAGFEAGRGAVRRGDRNPTWPEEGAS